MSAVKFLSQTGKRDYVKDEDLSLTDITTNNVTTTQHGFAPKAPNDTSQFFRGDAAWSSITGLFTFIKKSADESISSNATLQDDDDFQFSVSADQFVVLHYNIFWDTGNGSGGLQARILIPSLNSNYSTDSNLTLGIGQRQQSNGPGTMTNSVLPIVVSSGTLYSNTNVVSSAAPMTIGGWVMLPIGSSGGTVKIQWAQNNSNGTATTFRKGSYIGYVII